MKYYKKYDLMISLGEFCLTAMCLKKTGITSKTYPFDWSAGILWDKSGECGFKRKVDLICTDFFGAFEYKDFVEFPNPHDKNCHALKNLNTGLQYLHDFPLNKTIPEYFPVFIEKYKRRIHRLYEDIAKANSICFVFATRTKHTFPLTDIPTAYLQLNNKFPNKKINFLIFQDSYDIETAKQRQIIKYNDYTDVVLYKDPEVYDNFLVIGKTLSEYQNCEYYDFSQESLCVLGLSEYELEGRWSCSNKINLYLKTGKKNCDIKLDFLLNAFVEGAKKNQYAVFNVNGVQVAEHQFNTALETNVCIDVQKKINNREDGSLDISIDIFPPPVSPKDINLSEDERKIALFFRRLMIIPYN